MKELLGIFGGGVVASISGNAIWILVLVNLGWLLVKDYTLFSWWWVIGSAIVFLVSVVVLLFTIITKN